VRVRAYFHAGLEQADLFVTAIQFDRSDVTTLALPCQSIKPSRIRPIRTFSNGARRAPAELFWRLSLQKCESHIYEVHSISRCALLNAPAGSFSKDIDEVEGYRVIVTRPALVRFGE